MCRRPMDTHTALQPGVAWNIGIGNFPFFPGLLCGNFGITMKYWNCFVTIRTAKPNKEKLFFFDVVNKFCYWSDQKVSLSMIFLLNTLSLITHLAQIQSFSPLLINTCLKCDYCITSVLIKAKLLSTVHGREILSNFFNINELIV